MHVAGAPLEDWVSVILERSGVAPEAARLTAQLLVRTSLRGVDTHGIGRLPAYVKNLQDGSVNPRARPMVSERHGTLRCDGDGGLGQVVAVAALDAALARAESQAIVSCTIRGCGHLGALGSIVLAAAERGRVAVLCQRTPPIMGLPGFQGRAIGNNPLAFGLPVAGSPPLVFDMALSEVARGRIADAAREGSSAIPAGWAIDQAGQPTTDPQQALLGAVLPIAGHKGMGLAMLVQCLAGSLAGDADALDDSTAAGSHPGSTGAFLLVANPDLLVGRGAFDASVAGWLGHYRRAAPEPGRYPGQRQAQCERQRSRDGIPLAPGLLHELQELGVRSALPFPV